MTTERWVKLPSSALDVSELLQLMLTVNTDTDAACSNNERNSMVIKSVFFLICKREDKTGVIMNLYSALL